MTDELPLGRRVPTDWRHVERYGYAASIEATVQRVERTLRLPRYRTRYDQGGEGACFPAGTRVMLSSGEWRPIEQLRLLDTVRTAEGNARMVTALQVRWHNDGLFAIRLRGHKGLRCTAEHPILTKRGYVQARDLTIGDHVALPRANPQEREVVIRPRDMVPARDIGRAKVGASFGGVAVAVRALPETIALTPAFGRLCGLYLAEGATTPNRVQWCFGGHEREALVAETVTLVRSELGCESHVQFRASNVCNVVVYGKGWRLLFERLFSSGVAGKRLPGCLAAGPDDFLRGVLEGWLAGDGHRRRNEVSGVTVSHDLALSMFSIANNLGLAPTLSVAKPSVNRHAATRRDRWEVHISEGGGKNGPTVDEAATWRRVSSIEHEDWQGFVYNCEVAADHSYVAEGIGVHNCVGFAASWMMSIQNRRPYNPTWLWNQAKMIDDWPETNPGDAQGTSVRAAMDVLRKQGHVRIYRAADRPVSMDEGIAENRWARTVDEVRTCLASGVAITLGVNWYRNFDTPVLKGGRWWIGQGDLGRIRGGHAVCIYRASDRLQAVGIVNNWGTRYPLVLLPYETLERLLWEEGEATMITDRP